MMGKLCKDCIARGTDCNACERESVYVSEIEKAIKRIEQARDKDKIAEYPYNRCIKIIREVLNEG